MKFHTVFIGSLLLTVVSHLTCAADEPVEEKKYDKVASEYLMEFWKKQASESEDFAYPKLMWKDFRGGEVGFFRGDGTIPDKEGYATATICKVQQIISESEALVVVRLIYPDGKVDEKPYLFRGFDFAKYADDQWFEEQHVAIVNGTYKYETAIGGTKTVFVIEKVDVPKVPEHPAFLGVGMRLWTDVTGEFSVQAAFYKVEKGSAHLVKEDGKVIQVPVSRLSEADQALMRKSVAEERKRAIEKERKQSRDSRKRR